SLTITVLTPLTKGLPIGGLLPFGRCAGGAKGLISCRFRPSLRACGRVSEPGGSVPRLRPDRPSVALGLGAFAGIALAGGALAQTASETVPENGLFDPPSGQGVLVPDGGSDAQPMTGGPVTFGHPPGFGASVTGFDSTNARRKVQAQAARKNAQQP